MSILNLKMDAWRGDRGEKGGWLKKESLMCEYATCSWLYYLYVYIN